jgi:hypothetical protein
MWVGYGSDFRPAVSSGGSNIPPGCVVVIVHHTHTRPHTYSRTPQPPIHTQIQSLKAEANQVADQGIALVRMVRAFSAEEVEKRRYDARTLATVGQELRIKMLYAVSTRYDACVNRTYGGASAVVCTQRVRTYTHTHLVC